MKYYPNMYYMYIPIILDGIISSFISIYFSKLIYEGIRDRLNVGYLLMSEGVGCIFGAILSAFMSDKYSVINVGRAGIFAVLVTCGLTFANYMI
jgi:predicted MFS family arabinose efflux permease